MFFSYTKINFAMVMKVMGLLLVSEALFMLIPTATSAIYGEDDFYAFLYSAVASASVGLVLYMGIHPKSSRMAKREGYLLTALVWVVFSVFGLLPLLWGDVDISFSDAFFEAMSGFTTTGASVLDVDRLSHGIILWRCLMQWLGGMGIILFTLAVVPMLNNQGGVQMFNSEVTGITHDKLRPRVSQTAKSLWLVYFILTVALCAFLWIGPMNFFDALCHAFSTMSTGGFSTRSGSIGAWHSCYVDIVVIIFMFLGGVNFGLIFKTATGDLRAAIHNDTFKIYLKTIAVMMVLFIACILAQGQFDGWESITVQPLFQIVSTLTSTGYTAGNFEMWGTTILSLVFLMMFFGACAGSTSGGAKLDRLNFLLRNTRNEVLRAFNPNTIYTVRVNGKIVAAETVRKVIAFICIYMMVIVVGGVLLTALGLPLVDAFFSSFSCMSNTGLGAGVTGYGGNFEVVPVAGKWILSFIMLTGRLEIFTILVLFSRSFWLK